METATTTTIAPTITTEEFHVFISCGEREIKWEVTGPSFGEAMLKLSKEMSDHMVSHSIKKVVSARIPSMFQSPGHGEGWAICPQRVIEQPRSFYQFLPFFLSEFFMGSAWEFTLKKRERKVELKETVFSWGPSKHRL